MLSLPLHEEPETVQLRTWVQLVRTFGRIERRLSDVLDGQNMTLAQFEVLATLYHSEGLSQKELAELLLVTKGNVCGLLDRLEKLGWVMRRPDPEDGRVRRVHLTTHGRRRIEQALPAHDRAVSGVMGKLPAGEIFHLRRMLQDLEQALE